MSLKLLTELDMAEQARLNPNFPKEYLVRTKFSDKTTNELTKAVKRWLQLHGAQCERVSNVGRKIKSKGKEIFIPGTGRNGTSDLHSTIPIMIGGRKVGLSVKWEIKCAATKDRIRPAQLEYAKEVTDAGGIVYFIRTFDEFINRYNELMGC